MLYSVIVRFKAKEDIYFSYYPGESLHGMLFRMLSERDAQKAKELHDDYQTKPFTFSPILPYPSWEQGRKKLEAGKKHFFRVSFLEDKWYLLFMEYFLYLGAKLNLQGKEIEIREILTHSDQDRRCNSIEYDKLFNQAREERKIDFKFHSTATFRLGKRHLIFPQPTHLFYSLLKKWEEFGEQELPLKEEDFEDIYLSQYDLNSTMEKFNGYFIKGFQGSAKYELASSLSKEQVKALNVLADFAFYSGLGYKTTMGLGQIARV